ncbi:MAG: hypothetical protein QW096_11280 [Thermofilaceae archaeon]
MSELNVEKLFNFIDNVFCLSEIPNIIVLVFSTLIVFILSLFILYMAINKQINSRREKLRTATNKWLTLYTLSSLIMIIGFIYSFHELTINVLLVLGILMQVFTLILTGVKFEGFPRFSLLFMFYLSSILLMVFFSSKVLINGVDAAETTTDALQIYFEGHFRFSRHAGWYDLAPVDAIMKNFLMYILGVNNPYEPAVTTLMSCALSISFSIALCMLVKRLCNERFGNYAVALMSLVIHPYALLIGMSTFPTNFSLVFSMFALLLISKKIYDVGKHSIRASLMIIMVFTTAAILAHPMSILIPAYLIAVLLYEMIFVRNNSEDIKYALHLFLLSFIIFMLKAIYTGLREGTLTLINIIIEGLASLLAYEIKDISVYMGGPLPPKSTLFSFGAFPGVIAAIFFVEVVRSLRKKKADHLSIFVFSIVLVMTVLSVATNFFYPSSRYLGIPAIVLGAFQSMIYIIHMPNNKWRKSFIVLLGILCISSVLSPNAMIEHYNVFTGGRWPRVENFILSNFLIEHVDSGYVIDVFKGVQEARLHLFFADDILLYGHPYHHVNTLIVEKFLIPGIIEARSYWDFLGRLFVKYEGYIGLINETRKNIVFNGWKWVATWN